MEFRDIQSQFTFPLPRDSERLASMRMWKYPASSYPSHPYPVREINPRAIFDQQDKIQRARVEKMLMEEFPGLQDIPEKDCEEQEGVEGDDIGGRDKSPLVKKRASKEECTSSQPKKIKQEEGCVSSEITELKEKVDKLEAKLLEQQEKFCVLEQRLNSVTENRRSSCVKTAKVINQEKEIHEPQILRSFRPRFISAMENSLIRVADDLYSQDLIDEHTKRQAVALQSSNMSPHQRCSLIMDILITSMECIDGQSRRQTFIAILNVFKKCIPLRYVAVQAEEEYASLSE